MVIKKKYLKKMETTAKFSFDPIWLLKKMIAIPSFSGEEKEVANLISKVLDNSGIKHMRFCNNLWSFNKYFDPKKKTILLNSHIDTVKPNSGYSVDPFELKEEGGKLFGLGSNDAGGSLVALIQVFKEFYCNDSLKYNLILAITAEEENSGANGIRSILNQLPEIDFAIVGEPTEMKMAIAEKGLLVLDVKADGRSGHVAHYDNENAISKALSDIQWIENFDFEKKSDLLGEVKATVTQINAGIQHNIVPETCSFVVDIRINEKYSNQDVLSIMEKNLNSEFKPRSMHLNSSSIELEHPIVQAGIKMGLEYYGSPTLSDQANLNCPSLKIGPGKSERSHIADEFIYTSEIYEGIIIYKSLLESIIL